MNITSVGKGKVVLIAGGGKIYTDIAARFVGSEKSLEEILASPYDKKIVENILSSNHKAVLEFDQFIFGVEGYARVTEIQLLRKRIASYMVKTGRKEKKGKRSFDMVIPDSIKDFHAEVKMLASRITLLDGTKLDTLLPSIGVVNVSFDYSDILDIIEQWYDRGVELEIPEEELRYLKPQATEFKALIRMDASGIIDWTGIRCCLNAQTEIRDMANKMLSLSRKAAPDLFVNAGARCVGLGYCPENSRQNEACKGKIFTKEESLLILQKARKEIII
jgi:thymidylate synthase (FAD)